MSKQYRAARLQGTWAVLDRHNHAIYDSSSGELTQQEANDLAWAFNQGATSDHQAIYMIVNRYGRRPEWLIEEYPIVITEGSMWRERQPPRSPETGGG